MCQLENSPIIPIILIDTLVTLVTLVTLNYGNHHPSIDPVHHYQQHPEAKLLEMVADGHLRGDLCDFCDLGATICHSTVQDAVARLSLQPSGVAGHGSADYG